MRREARLAQARQKCNTAGRERTPEVKMSDTPISATETALENQRIGGLQIRVVESSTAFADSSRNVW
jgi:hypothetical protein